MKKINFAFALHFHQPVGNFDKIIERAWQSCYKPFFELLYNYPNIKMSIHISGCLLDYFESKHPDIIELIKEMVARGQLEMIGGGYYEPIFPAIPERDIHGQIKMMSEYIKERFDYIPRGLWIPERVWDSRLIKPIHKAGMRYAILDDSHLLRAGISKENMHGYFSTGKDDQQIAIFPSDKFLRYTIPFKIPFETLEYFRSAAKDDQELLFIYGDDGEKFGEWPGTHEWVFGKGWLKNFFELLDENRDWIKMVQFSEYLNEAPALDNLDIPRGSYDEMMEWTDGDWMNFLDKYPETEQMYKRMHYVSDKVERAGKKIKKADKQKLEAVKSELYKGQCNCGYWHGVFGGLYLYHLRNAIYNHLISAEKAAESILYKDNWFKVEETDFKLNRSKNLIVENKNFFLCFDLERGGVIKELDYKPFSHNLINTLSRREEAYHKKILSAASQEGNQEVQTIHDDFRTVSPDFQKKLVYDKFSRSCLRNYFIDEQLNLGNFSRGAFDQIGDFADGVYHAAKKKSSLILSHKAKINTLDVELTKELVFKSDKNIEIEYQINKNGPGDIDGILAVEFNFTLPYLNSSRYTYYSNNGDITNINAQGWRQDITFFGLSDKERGLGINLDFLEKPLDLWYFPVETISQSEKAYELNYQCSCVVLRYKPKFNQGNNWKFKINWRIID